MGGASILDTYASGTLTTDDPDVSSISITTQTKGVAERFDTSSPKEQTFVLNGAQSWALRSGKQERVSYAFSAFHRPEHVPALACLLDLPKANMSFVYLGVETVNGQTAHHIKIFLSPSGEDSTDSILSELNLFLDVQSLIVLKTERFVFDPHALENRSVWATSYSDYRRIGEALMPFHIENCLDGHKVRDITFSSVQVNVGLSDLLFKK
jgi:outer membrane lipoprotein-sorting protein